MDIKKLPPVGGRRRKRRQVKSKADRKAAASVPPPQTKTQDKKAMKKSLFEAHPDMQPRGSAVLEKQLQKPSGTDRIASLFASGVAGGNRKPIQPLVTTDKNGKRVEMGMPAEHKSVAQLREEIKAEMIQAREKENSVSLPDIKNSPEGSISHGKHKPRVSLAQKARERYDSSVNTRSIRCLISKPGQMLDADQTEAEMLSSETGFNVKKIKELRRMFRSAVKRDPGLMVGPFKKVMAAFGIKNERMVGRVFDVLDEFRAKHLTFEQFVMCIHLFIKGSRIDQAKVLFKMIDESDDRSISRLEMLHFFAGGLTHRDEKKLVASIVDEMMHMIDEDGSGEVTFDEFVNEVAGDEDVWNCFQSISPLTQLIKAMNFDVDT